MSKLVSIGDKYHRKLVKIFKYKTVTYTTRANNNAIRINVSILHIFVFCMIPYSSEIGLNTNKSTKNFDML